MAPPNTPWRGPRSYERDARPAEVNSYGVLSPASLVLETEVGGELRWTTGFEYETRDCSTEVTVSSVTGLDSYAVVEREDVDCYREYAPFQVGVQDTRSTFNAETDWQDDVEVRLHVCQQKAIERELWTGTLARAEDNTNRYLASTDAVDVTPPDGAVKPAYGLALLEGALADCGCGTRGTVHTTHSVGSALGLSPNDDGAAETALGTYAVVGAGYTGSGPGDVAASGTAQWLYATGPLTVRLGPIEHRSDDRRSSLDVQTNRYSVYAERAAAVTWDSCCHLAVLVDLALDYS